MRREVGGELASHSVGLLFAAHVLSRFYGEACLRIFTDHVVSYSNIVLA